MRTFGVIRTEELNLFDYGLLELCQQVFGETALLRSVIMGIGEGGGKPFIFRP